MATNNAVNNGLTGATGTVNFVGSTSPTIITPRIVNQINDANGGIILGINAAGGTAVNYLQIFNTATGAAPGLQAEGIDTNVGIQLQTKGTGVSRYYSLAVSDQFQFNTGTTYQKVTNFNFANTGGTNEVTFPDASGTVSLLGNSSTGTGAVVLQTSPTIITPQIGQINDTNGNGAILINATGTAVNYSEFTNAATGGPVSWTAIGTDTNIGVNIAAKGTGALNFFTTATSSQFKINSGAAFQHTSIFNLPSASSVSQYTFPDATGTVALQTTGVWTPIDTSGAALTLTSVSGGYTVIGNMVFAYASFAYPVTADGSGAQIGGLPFTVANQNYANQGLLSFTNSSAATMARASGNTTTFNFYNNTGTQITNVQMTGSTNTVLITYPLT